MYKPISNKVEKMFSTISKKYDLLNHTLSFGMDFRWRSKLAKQVILSSPKNVLDLATGSGDVAFKLSQCLSKDTKITAMDFCQPMLDIAKSKQSKLGKYENIDFIHGDALNMDFNNDSFDAVTIAFGVRNLENRQKGFSEILRVLKPGGTLYILEFSQPSQYIKPIYYLYLKYIIPSIAGFISKDKNAYKYLAGTIESFPSKQLLSEQLITAGYKTPHAAGMTFSTVAIHQAMKSS